VYGAAGVAEVTTQTVSHECGAGIMPAQAVLCPTDALCPQRGNTKIGLKQLHCSVLKWLYYPVAYACPEL